MTKNNIIAFIIAIVICQLAGITGALFSASAIPEWYVFLNKPPLNPPAEVFAPVWTVLYLLMGTSLFLVWKKRTQAKSAYIAFGIQLALNTLWSIIFFGLKSPVWAFVDIVLMLVAIVVTIILFYRISKPAGLLFVPYLLWVCFATYLNAGIWLLN